MASNVVSIAVQANSDQLTKAFDKGATAGERFKGKMQLVAKAVVAALAFKAAQAITDFVGDSIEAFSDLNESLNALEVTFGDEAEGIKKLGEEAAANLGLSNAEFNNFAVQMSAFAQEIAGDGGDVVGVVDTLSTRVSDFASVMNLDVADAAQKFQAGLAGETEPLRKFGIDVSAAKVKTVALAEGIIEAGEEMTESEKITARFRTIMQQTSEVQGDFANTATDYANAQRIANAEMEDSKALLGEILIPLAKVGTEVQTGLIKSVNDASITLGALTGDFDEAQAALLSFENETGRSAKSVSDTIKGVELSWQSWSKEIDVWSDALFGGTNRIDDMVAALNGLIDEQELGADGIRDLQSELEELRATGEVTEEQYLAMSDTLDVRLSSALTGAEEAARAAFAANVEYEDGLEEVEEQVEDTTTALERHIGIMQESHDQLREQIDPLFALKEAQRDVEDAQVAVNEAIEEFGEGSPEHLEALEGETDAYLDLEQAEIDVKEAGELTREEFVNQQRELGHTKEDAELLADSFEILEGFEFKPKSISINAHLSAADRALFGSAGVPGLQHGGIATGPILTAIGEGGDDEAVIPLNTQGIKILGAALREAMGGSGGLSIVVNAGMGADGDDIGRRIVDAISSYERRNGTAWRAS